MSAHWLLRLENRRHPVAARRDDLLSIVSPSKSCIAGPDAKRPRSSKQFTLTTARTPSLKSATAAINTPQRRQMRKSQVRVPNRYRSTSDQSSAPTHGSWLNLVEGFFSKLMAS